MAVMEKVSARTVLTLVQAYIQLNQSRTLLQGAGVGGHEVGEAQAPASYGGRVHAHCGLRHIPQVGEGESKLRWACQHQPATTRVPTALAVTSFHLLAAQGAVRRVVVRNVQLKWDANGQGSGRLWSLLSGSPCIRLQLSGVRVTLTGPAPIAPQSGTPHAGTPNGGDPQDAAASAESEGSASQYLPSLGLLQLLSISIEDVAVDVEVGKPAIILPQLA